MKFFGKKKSTLTDKEQDLAAAMYKDFVKAAIVEEAEVATV
jgi:hypothetical protein